MERHEIFEMMRALKLAGMRAVYDETMRAGIQHKRAPTEILGDLLKAELAEKTARSVRYQMSAAQFPVMKHLAEFDFDAAPVNEALVRSLHDGDFMDQTRNAVFVGGTGTGKSHLAIAIGVNAVNSRRRVRFFSAVDLVNRLDADIGIDTGIVATAGRAGVACGSEKAETDGSSVSAQTPDSPESGRARWFSEAQRGIKESSEDNFP